MNYDKIGEFIASKRKEKNMTQSDLAKKLGVTVQAVSKWERGLGCPDVSILEVLSKELEVSILELLKGRKIENEVINVTEADDYIKDTYKKTKQSYNNELKQKISLILTSISIFIIGIMCVLNINTYKDLTYTESFGDLEYLYEEDEYEKPNSSFHYRKSELKKYIEIIEKNKGSLSDEEQKIFLTSLKAIYKYYDESFLFNLKKGVKLSFNDIYVKSVIDFEKYPFTNLAETIDIYKKYTGENNSEDLHLKQRSKLISEGNFVSRYNDLFKNQLQLKLGESLYDSQQYLLTNIIESHMDYLIPILEITEGIMKGAGINE